MTANLTEARNEYRNAQVAYRKAEELAKNLAGNADGLQALRSANQQLKLTFERYEKALKEFIDYRPHFRGG